ncbi:hypothetical protein PpBr36_04109 [Pyricularia pennisetigena]|uniref:hypothetical protein n=1 Tax=Pyricularia pennisetigena TaxID=1578925 RepID=UPI00114DCFED|nr:hypothetical protein PpBr36_04109 [Pyricularia pennisetigena]TLS27435.1 hypothetical protein PpBr36_04109 [Pyricularia pennisetigena]
MHTVLTGATGLVGSAVLDAMLSNPAITKITILSRRPVAQATARADPRVSVVLHDDFTSYDDDAALRSRLQDARGCVWALGVSQTQVGSRDEYERITKTFALAAARSLGDAARRAGEPFDFVYVSGMGATTTPGRFAQLFARVKGETELGLAALQDENPLLRASSVRAGFVDPAAHGAIAQYLPARPVLTTAMEKVLGPVVRGFWKSAWSPTEHLGRFLTDMAIGKWSEKELVAAGADKIGKGGFLVVENPTFRKLQGLDA